MSSQMQTKQTSSAQREDTRHRDAEKRVYVLHAESVQDMSSVPFIAFRDKWDNGTSLFLLCVSASQFFLCADEICYVLKDELGCYMIYATTLKRGKTCPTHPSMYTRNTRS